MIRYADLFVGEHAQHYHGVADRWLVERPAGPNQTRELAARLASAYLEIHPEHSAPPVRLMTTIARQWRLRYDPKFTPRTRGPNKQGETR